MLRQFLESRNAAIASSVGFTLLLLVGGCSQNGQEPLAQEALPPAIVRVQSVEAKKRFATEEVVGTVRAKLRASIEAKISGRIKRLPVELGQAVKAGDLLAELDAGEIQARLDQATAQRDQAERDLKRFADLLRQEVLTQAEYDAVEARSRIAKAAVEEATTMLGYARVTAPFDGVITRKLADVGDLAAPGRALVEMEDPRALQLVADVPEAIIDRVTPGAVLAVRVASLPGALEGKVSEIAPAADPNTRTFQVKLDLPSVPGLRTGGFGRVAVPVAETTALRVPTSAVIRRGQLEMVFVVEADRAQLRLVKTGKRVGDEVELVSGVGAGEQVVVEGAAALQDGQPVVLR